MLLNILAICLPTLAIVVGILLNQKGLIRLEARLDGWIARLESRRDSEMAGARAEASALRP